MVSAAGETASALTTRGEIPAGAIQHQTTATLSQQRKTRLTCQEEEHESELTHV